MRNISGPEITRTAFTLVGVNLISRLRYPLCLKRKFPNNKKKRVFVRRCYQWEKCSARHSIEFRSDSTGNFMIFIKLIYYLFIFKIDLITYLMSCHNKRKWSHLRTIRIDPLHSGWKRWIRLTEFPACSGDFTRFRFQTLIESHFHDHFGITGVITLRHWIEILAGLNWQLRPVFTRWAVSSAPEQWPSIDYLHHAKIFGCWLATTWM